jgi:WD40 repeat protein
VSVSKLGGLARLLSLPALLCILALCSGCLVTQTVANESAPTMRSLPVEVPAMYADYGLRESQFSPDGKHILAGWNVAFVNLSNTATGRSRWSSSQSEYKILGLGFIDDDTFFIGTRAILNAGTDAKKDLRQIRFHSISAPAQSTAYEFPDGRDMEMLARGNHVYYDAQLLDRRDGRIQRVITAHAYGPPAHLMADGKVLTLAHGQMVLFDPATDDYQHWRTESGIFLVSASERFVITLADNGSCSVWSLPSTARIERCSFRSFFRSEDAYAQAVHPRRERFAVAWGDTLRVYDLEPFQLVFERTLDSEVTGLTFSQGNLFAAALRGGRILVWNLDEARLLGRYDFNYDRLSISNELFQFSPDGRQLLTGAHAPVLLEVP